MPRKNTSRSSAPAARSVKPRATTLPDLPPLHPTQAKLKTKAMKWIENVEEDEPYGITFQVVGFQEKSNGSTKGKPGAGKTRLAGHIAREFMMLKANELDGPVAGFFVANNTDLALEHKTDIGAEHAPFQSHMTSDVALDLRLKKQVMISMTRAMFYKFFTHKNPDFSALKEFIAKTNIKGLLLILDESHSLYKEPTKLPTLVAQARVELAPLVIDVMGITATPGYDKQQSKKGATMLYGHNLLPESLVCKKADFEQMMVDTKVLPDPPNKWETIDVGSPIGKSICAATIPAIHEAIVKLFLAKTNLFIRPSDDDMTVDRVGKLKDIVAVTTVIMAVGTDGGKLIDLVTRGDVQLMTATGGNAESGAKPAGEPFVGKESVLIALQTRGAEKEMANLLNKIATSGVNSNPLSVHDLTIDARKLNERRAAVEAVYASFKAQTSTTLAIIGQSDQEGKNDFAKAFSTVITVGQFAKDKIIQVCGRVGRMGKQLGNGDPVPVAYKAAHLFSSFAQSLSGIDNSAGLRDVNICIPEDIANKVGDVQAALEANRMGNANDLIEINVKKLIKADEYLQSDGAVANKYIDALWDTYLPDEEQPSIDNASNGGVAELSDEQDPEEEGEEDGEEEEEGILDGGSSQVEG